eukprot:g41878.t1
MMRSRKGKGGHRGDENSSRSESKNVAESPSAPAGVSLLWTFLLLLIACGGGGGFGCWYIQQQLQSIASLDQTVQTLQKKLSQFDTIQAEVNELSQKLLTTEEYEQRLLNLEVAQSDSERKVDKTVVAVAQIQASDLE